MSLPCDDEEAFKKKLGYADLTLGRWHRLKSLVKMAIDAKGVNLSTA